MSSFIPAFLIGFLGSMHCVGMCGPLALAIPAGRVHSSRWLVNRSLYQLGRILMYACLGAVLAVAGKGIAIAGWQQGLAITAGIFLLLLAILPTQVERWAGGAGWPGKAVNRLRKPMGSLIRKGGLSATFTLGMLNGLLPCGLVYLGLAGALLSGSALQGATWMAAFGLGTLPAMALVLGLGSLIKGKAQAWLRRGMPVMAGLMGLLLIVRGLNLGIPYLSPVLEWTEKAIPLCGGL